MRRLITFAILTACGFLGPQTFGEDIPLFNGKDLTGWTGNLDMWKVEDGVIVGSTNGLNYNTFLINDKPYGDFELHFKAKLDKNNSGVQFRSKLVDPAKFVLSGYQADIADGYWGLLYEEKARGMLDFKKNVKGLAHLGEWADYVIRAKGPDITISVNGTETVHYVEKDDKAGAKSGLIGLQLHAGQAMKVYFKDLILKPL